jgi:hypothetical protein
MNAISWALATCICLAIAGLLAGCAAGFSAQTPTPDPGAPLDAGPPAKPGEVLVEVRRQGGIAGWDDRLLLYADGRAVLERRSGTQALELEPQVVERIAEQLDRAGFSTLPPEILPDDACCDLFEYWVTYRGHTVHTLDPAAPDALWPVIALLDEIIGSVRKT